MRLPPRGIRRTSRREGRRARCLVVFAAFLIAGALAAQSGPVGISAGPNVRVSAANGGRLHHEVTIAASPADPQVMLACSMIFDAKDASRHVVAYRTADGGRSWKPVLEVRRSTFVGDPTCTFGLDGSAYLSALALHYESAAEHEMLVYRSRDAGATWSAEPTLLPFIDRQWLVVDQTSGPRRGSLYLHGNAVRDATVDGDERIVFTYYRSSDGASFPAPRKLLPDGDHMSFGTGNSVILSDGTWAVCFPEWSDRKNIAGNDDFRKAGGSIKVVRSKDGGETFSKAVAVADWHGCQGWTPGLPVLAVDASDGPFRDHLYVTWPDRRSGRCEILLSSSADHGDTWSMPLVINDDQSPAERDRGRDHLLPAVAVNPAGVVGVSWSDRRHSDDNIRGWEARFSASLDGGETFTPSVKLSEAVQSSPEEVLPIMAYSQGGGQRRPRSRGGNLRMELGPQWIDFLCAADTAGIAADAGGAFHPLWVDSRTGVPQIWTAAVRVEGRPALHGSLELAALAEITQQLAVDFSNTDYDPKTRIVSLDAVLTNTSEKAILAPLKLRLISLQSSSAVPEALETENHISGAGGVWDFTPQLNAGQLAPGQTSRPRRLRFRLSPLAPFKLDKRGSLGNLVSVETKAFAKEEPR